MYAQAERSKDSESKAVAGSISQKRNFSNQGLEFKDNRRRNTQLKMMEMVDFYNGRQDDSISLSPKNTSMGLVQLQVDPNATTWLGRRVPTFELQREFYYSYVYSEYTRALAFTPTDTLHTDIVDAGRVYWNRVRNARKYDYRRNWHLVFQALDNLIVAVNRGLDAYDAGIRGRMSIGNQDTEHVDQIRRNNNRLRLERRLRSGIRVRLGINHKNDVRGFKSVAEGNRVLASIQAALQTNGINDGRIAIRGSAIRGTNRTGERPYREGTGDLDMANDSSDLDFFFTSPTLEHAIDRYLDGNHYEGGGNVHPDTLNDFLENSRLHLPGVNQPGLKTALDTFSTNTKTLIGRKSDVTMIKANEINSFSDDEYILV